MTADELANAYGTLNTGRRRKLIYHLTNRGFSSELNNMILGVLYCLVHGIEFQLHSRFWVSGYDWGWHDYFLPFCVEQDSAFLKFRNVSWSGLRYRVYKALFPHRLLIHDIWESMRSDAFTRRRFRVPKLHIDGDIFHAKQVLLRMVYRLNPATRELVNELVPKNMEPYVGIHVRRGDKLNREASSIPLSEYYEKLAQLDSSITNVFLATDDYRVVEDFGRLCSGYKLFTLCRENSRGFDIRTYESATHADRRTQVQDFLADIDCLSNASFFIGTYSSNVGRMVALRSGKSRCFSMDRDWFPR